MKKRMKKKLMKNYNCVWKPNESYQRPVPLRSERKEPHYGPVTFMDWAKYVRKYWFDPPKFNKLRGFLSEFMLREEYLYDAAGEIKIAKRYRVYRHDGHDGSDMTSEEIHSFTEAIGFHYLPFELGQVMISLDIISEGEPWIPDPELDD